MENNLININSLLYRTMNDADLAKDVLYDYLNEIPKLFSDIKNALDSEDYNKLKNLAHKIKGASASIGANVMKIEAESLESLAMESNKSTIKNHLEIFKGKLDETIETIKKLELMV